MQQRKWRVSPEEESSNPLQSYIKMNIAVSNFYFSGLKFIPWLICRQSTCLHNLALVYYSLVKSSVDSSAQIVQSESSVPCTRLGIVEDLRGFVCWNDCDLPSYPVIILAMVQAKKTIIKNSYIQAKPLHVSP